MAIYKPKRLLNDGSLEEIKFPLDSLDGSEDLTFHEIEISDEVAETSTNLVTSKGVYNAIKNANHGYVLEITASQSLNSIPYFTIPNLSTTDVANLAKAYTQQKPTFIHYAPTGSTPHYYRVDSANYDTSASSNFVAEVHIHVDIDLVKTIGESLCLEILYQSNGSTVAVRSNPNILYQTTAFFNEVNEDLPNLSGASITSIVNESIVGDITKIIGYDNSGHVETIDVISRGFNDTENWITYCWKNKIYKMTYRDSVVSAELLKAVSDADRNTWNGKQDALTFDSTPANGSLNPVTSSGIKSAIDSVDSKVNAINSKIPNQATSNNQLADKDFVNSSINNVAAYFITKNSSGDSFATKAELASTTTFYSGGTVRIPTRNDYCIVLSDETKIDEVTGKGSTTRYIYNNGWELQYIVNNSPFTAAQLASLNSGITSSLVSKINTNESKINKLNQQPDYSEAGNVGTPEILIDSATGKLVFKNIKGEKGDKGDTGEKGDTGATGPRGVKGVQGPTGNTGPSISDISFKNDLIYTTMSNGTTLTTDIPSIGLLQDDDFVITTSITQNSNDVPTSGAVYNAISSKADKATTLSGYGITDAKISGQTITLGSNSVKIPSIYVDSSGYLCIRTN